jgi:hypothetical protein
LFMQRIAAFDKLCRTHTHLFTVNFHRLLHDGKRWEFVVTFSWWCLQTSCQSVAVRILIALPTFTQSSANIYITIFFFSIWTNQFLLLTQSVHRTMIRLWTGLKNKIDCDVTFLIMTLY